MKKIIRQNTFETNSSSTHAICIATESALTLPKKLTFKLGEFGWEWKSYSSPEDKAAYLFTAIVYTNEDESREQLQIDDWSEIQWIKNTLDSYGVVAIFQDPVWRKSSSGDCFWLDYGYIDHGWELKKEFLTDILSDENVLIQYLFSDKSYIKTGNDNSDRSVDIRVNYPHKEYYKWN